MIKDFDSTDAMYKYFKKLMGNNIFVQIKLFTALSPDLQDTFIEYYKMETAPPVDPSVKATKIVFSKR